MIRYSAPPLPHVCYAPGVEMSLGGLTIFLHLSFENCSVVPFPADFYHWYKNYIDPSERHAFENHDFHVVVGKQCGTENAYAGH